MEKRIESGIPGMDQIIGGGFLPASSLLLIGPSGTGKSTYCRELVNRLSKKGMNSLIVLTNMEPSKLHEIMEGKKVSNIKVINGYSWRKGRDHPDAVKSLKDLNEFKARIEKNLGDSQLIIIDSLTDLLMENDPTSVYKFCQLIVGLVKQKNLLLIACLETGLHGPAIENTLTYITDGTIEMRLENDQRMMRVTRMNSTPHPLVWIPFEIKKDSFEVKVEEFLR